MPTTNTINYTAILEKIHSEVKGQPITGKVADYIPELAHVDPTNFGMHIYCMESGHHSVGLNEKRFSIQSISKVLALMFTMQEVKNKEIFKRVDVEPSGDPFNSLIQLEREKGIPRNPFINAGALVISDMLVSLWDQPKQQFLEKIRVLSQNPTLDIDQEIYESELAHNDRNASLVHLMKSFGNIENDVDEVLDLYTFQCSIMVSCKELSTIFSLFAKEGWNLSGDRSLSEPETKRINAIMQTCGFYDEAGEFSFRVGLPGKSGVGGGIVAVHPGKYSVTVWSPPLNRKGNSELGMYALERLTTLTGLSIF